MSLPLTMNVCPGLMSAATAVQVFGLGPRTRAAVLHALPWQQVRSTRPSLGAVAAVNLCRELATPTPRDSLFLITAFACRLQSYKSTSFECMRIR